MHFLETFAGARLRHDNSEAKSLRQVDARGTRIQLNTATVAFVVHASNVGFREAFVFS